MDLQARLDELAAPLRADVLSGASEVVARAAEIIRVAALELPATSRDELRAALGALVVRLLEAQPSMAPLLMLARGVLAPLEGGPGAPSTIEGARRAAAAAAEAFRNGLRMRTRRVAERATRILPGGGLVPAGGLVATVSSSATVRAALLLHADHRAKEAPGERMSVLCFESRPLSEGRMLARALSEAGVAVTYAVDAAMHVLASTCHVVVLGADSIGDRGVVNKIGSAALAHAARAANVPVYVLADETKILPSEVPQPLDDHRPADEVWAAPPPGVSAWNHYFETVPLDLVTGVVTESGVLRPDELEHVRSGMDLPGWLRAWAEGRARPTPYP